MDDLTAAAAAAAAATLRKESYWRAGSLLARDATRSRGRAMGNKGARMPTRTSRIGTRPWSYMSCRHLPLRRTVPCGICSWCLSFSFSTGAFSSPPPAHKPRPQTSRARLQETICSQADRVVAASMSEQATTPMDDGAERAMVTTQGTHDALIVLCVVLVQRVSYPPFQKKKLFRRVYLFLPTLTVPPPTRGKTCFALCSFHPAIHT